MTVPITVTFIPGPRLIDGTDLNTLVAQINAIPAVLGVYPSITALNTVGNGTITAAGIVGTVTARGGAQSGSAFTDTTDTAALIIAAMPAGAQTNASFLWRYQNTTNANATIAAGSGVTLSGNSIVPSLMWSEYLVVKTSGSTVSITFVDAGELSPLPVSKVSTETSFSTLSVSGLTGAQYNSVTLPNNFSLGVFPTATDLIAATPNARIGMSFQVQIRNVSAITAQLSGLTGNTLAGTSPTLIQANTARTYNVAFPSLSSTQITGIASTTL